MHKTILNMLALFMLALLVSVLSAKLTYANFVDPTRPPPNIHGETVMSPSLFVLNGIIIGPDRKIAMINGVNVKLGDVIFGEQVTAIHQNTVRLEGPSGKITLFLFGQPIKQLLRDDF